LGVAYTAAEEAGPEAGLSEVAAVWDMETWALEVEVVV